ncbi:MAG: CusA/CzcA family heavy metal efflux RND transporter [Polyangiales bacterium]
MIERMVRFALQQRLVVLFVALILIGTGVWAFKQLQIEAYPDISDTQVVVVTLLPGRAAEEVERLVTVPIERALNRVPEVIARRSRTIFGLSVVELTFDYGTNDWFARQVVLEALSDATLPEDATSSLGPLSTPIGELYRYTIEAEDRDPIRLRELQDWVIEPRLLQVPGVADVTPFGGLVKQFQIELDPLKLDEYALSVGDVAEAVDANNKNAGGALLDTGQQSLAVRGVGAIQSIEDLESVLVTESEGVPVFVHDLGHVRIGGAPPTGIFGIGEDTVGVEGIVLMRRGENPTEVLTGVKEAVAELNASRLPPDVRIVPIYDRAQLVDSTLHTVTHTLTEGLLIVVGVLLFFLVSVRAAIITAITIPLSLLFAFVCMQLTGIPANLLSLGALDFGIIVDGSLVMVERIVHVLSTGQSARPADEKATRTAGVIDAVRTAALEVGRPIFFSMMIIVAAYIPLFTLQRVERRLFTPMAFTVSYALIGALLLSLTLVPVLATYVFPGPYRGRENRALHWLRRQYGRGLTFTLRRAGLTVGVALAVVAASFVLGTRLGSEFLPQLDEGVIWIRANLTAGTSLSESAEVAKRIRATVARPSEVLLVSSQTGRNDSGTDPYGPNRNELFVALSPYDAWPSGKRKADLVQEISAALRAEIPGATFSFTQPIIDNVTEAVTGSAADLAVIIRGPDLNRLRSLGAQILEAVRQVPGATDPAIEQDADQPQLVITIDRQEAGRYGVSVSDLQDVIELAIGGRAVSTAFEGERRFAITARYPPADRGDPAAIDRILVPTREGGRVPLAQLATVEVRNGTSIVARRENQRQITVRTNIRGIDQGSFVEEAQDRVQNTVRIPAGYHIEWGGQFENLTRAKKRLTFIVPITIGIIFALLFFMFRSPLYAGIVLMNVPFSLVGGLVALWLRGIHLSVSAAVGFISLFGVAVMSGVLVVAEINRRRREPNADFAGAVLDGTLAQMRPVLMMIVVALLGMLPAANATGIGSDIQRPLATVIVGGLGSTLVLTLFALPSLYHLLARPRRPKDKINNMQPALPERG